MTLETTTGTTTDASTGATTATPARCRFDLSGSVALVTGASGGLGRHFAEVLAGAGAAVAVTARRTNRCAEVAAGIVARGGRAVAVRLDVTDAASVAAAFAEAEAALGPVGVLVNNSGIAASVRTTELLEADFDAVMDTNLKGAWLAAAEAARRAKATGTALSIVNVASILGLRVTGHVSAYAASKAGLIQLTKAMALELARDGVRVNAIAPGYIETDINSTFFASEAGQAMVRRIPQRRLGVPADLDGPLLLLASDASRYMTGAVIAVDGGHLVSPL
jgi:NAD(P)-dependent dehydrogenase (short-subunit alcohol dehydrogenase family)